MAAYLAVALFWGRGLMVGLRTSPQLLVFCVFCAGSVAFESESWEGVGEEQQQFRHTHPWQM